MSFKSPTDTKKHSIPNNSELFGTIHYSKNINLDDEGIITLASRAVSIQNEASTANLGLPVAFGRKSVFASSVSYAMVQNRQKAYWVTLAESGITFNVHIGTGVATLTADSHGCWYKNKWHITDDDDIFWLDDITDIATYTEITTGGGLPNLTSGKAHYLEVFRNKNALCVTNGNKVQAYTESSGTYTATTTLTIPDDYEAIMMKYSGYRMGIIATLSDTTQGQNQEAFFFVWNGANSEAE